MAAEPDRLRRDIEKTRATLTRDVDLLAEKTSPTKVAHRRWNAMKEKVMGSTEHARHAASVTTSSAASTVQEKASHLGDVVSEKAHKATDAARGAPRAVTAQTQGNPIAAGIVAFGIGMLAAALLPVTDTERRTGQQLKEHSGEFTDEIKNVAMDVKDDLSDNVRQAVTEVKDTAQDAMQTTREQAQSSAQHAKEETTHAAQYAS